MIMIRFKRDQIGVIFEAHLPASGCRALARSAVPCLGPSWRPGWPRAQLWSPLGPWSARGPSSFRSWGPASAPWAHSSSSWRPWTSVMWWDSEVQLAAWVMVAMLEMAEMAEMAIVAIDGLEMGVAIAVVAILADLISPCLR